MFKTVAWFVIAFLSIMMFSCSDSPTEPKVGEKVELPPDTAFSLWNSVTSTDTLPDTLHWGGSVTFIVCIGDTDGDPVTASVTGVPDRFANISASGDSTFIMLSLVGDSLHHDSLYDIRIRALAGEVDTLTLRYALQVLDTNRIGGIRKLVKDMWWTEVETTVTISFFDTTTGTRRDSTMEIRRKYNVVRNAFDTDSGIVYLIDSYDTLSNNSVEQGTARILHNDTSVYFIFPVLEIFVDSFRFKALDLPPVIGKSWEIINVPIDTVIDVPVDTVLPWITIPMRFNGAWIGSTTVADTVRYLYGGLEQKCYDITSVSTGRIDMTLDTTLVIPFLPNDTIYAGDTIGWSDSRTDGKQYFSDMFTIPLWSSEIEIKHETNYFDTTSKADTLRKYKHVTSFYDPRTDKTVIK